MSPRMSILFVCEGNSCRSVIAEALARQRLGAQCEVRSAGLNPQPEYDSKSAIRVLKEQFGIDASGHRQTNVRSLDIDSFTHVIALDVDIAERLRRLTSREVIVWHVDDPWEGDRAQYQLCAVNIVSHLDRLVDQLRAS